MEGSAASTAPYEFGPAENDTLESAAQWVGTWAWISMISGVVMGAAGAFTVDVGTLVVGIVYVVVGVYFRGAAASLRSVVETAGDDIEHLMTAVEKLTAAFKVMGILVIAAVLVGLVAGIVAGTGAALAN